MENVNNAVITEDGKASPAHTAFLLLSTTYGINVSSK